MFQWIVKIKDAWKNAQEEKQRKFEERYNRVIHGVGLPEDKFIDLTSKGPRRVKKGLSVVKLPDYKK